MSVNNERLITKSSCLKDPPPEFAFEIAADGIAMSRTRPPAAVQHAALASGRPRPLAGKRERARRCRFGRCRQKAGSARGIRRRGAQRRLILPDNCVRIAVLEFDSLPEKEEERRALIRFRLRKSVPFDVDEAALAWYQQIGNSVVVALAPAEIIAHYEAPFRAAGLQSRVRHGLLAGHAGLIAVHRLVSRGAAQSRTLTTLAVKAGAVTIARSIDLAEDSPDPIGEIASDIYPTIAYIEDQTGARPEKLYLAGFGYERNQRRNAPLRRTRYHWPRPYPKPIRVWPVIWPITMAG